MRLRKVVKQSAHYGRRVQNSVFECIMDSAGGLFLKAMLTEIINEGVSGLQVL